METFVKKTREEALLLAKSITDTIPSTHCKIQTIYIKCTCGNITPAIKYIVYDANWRLLEFAVVGICEYCGEE